MALCAQTSIHKLKKARSGRFKNVLNGLFSQSRPLSFWRQKKHAAGVAGVLFCLLFLGVGVMNITK